MAYDFKKEFKQFYQPKQAPAIIEVPRMNFLAVRGHGDPNEVDGEYGQAVTLLYGVAYTLRMSYKGEHQIPDFFEYVVPPLEGFWWQAATQGVDYSRKSDFNWISLIRLPDFIRESDVEWAKETATAKKGLDFSPVEWLTYDEGLSVQALHVGPFDSEPATVKAMTDYALGRGYQLDINDQRYHHEIYLSDFRKTAPEKLRTIIRHPIRQVMPQLR